MRERTLYIAARHPEPGQVKTRLAASIGHAAATDLYAAFLRDLERTFSAVDFAVRWYTSGRWGQGPHLDQGDGDWTTRQARLFRNAAARGEQRVVLIASDSPQLTPSTVRRAFARLRSHQLVLGPVDDGGYYLIGMRGWHDVFSGVRMSTPDVVQNIWRRAERLQLSVSLLDPTFDVDVVDDLAQLVAVLRRRPDLINTRAALDRILVESAA